MPVAEYGIAMIGLVVVFGFYWKQTKPTIVKVIWGVTTLGILNGVTSLVLFSRDGQRERVLKGLQINSFTLIAKTISETIHWLLAIEYFTVVSKFPLVWTAANYSYPDEIDAKAKRANTTIRVLNIVFYTLVLAYIIVSEYFF